jgi:hypothetical protein
MAQKELFPEPGSLALGIKLKRAIANPQTTEILG